MTNTTSAILVRVVAFPGRVQDETTHETLNMAEKEGFAKFTDDNNTFIPRNSGGTAMAVDSNDPIVDEFSSRTGNDSPGCDNTGTPSGVSAAPGPGDRRSITPQPAQPNSNYSSSTLPLFSAADNRLDKRKQNRNISQSETKDLVAELICPRVNCPEKIVSFYRSKFNKGVQGVRVWFSEHYIVSLYIERHYGNIITTDSTLI